VALRRRRTREHVLLLLLLLLPPPPAARRRVWSIVAACVAAGDGVSNSNRKYGLDAAWLKKRWTDKCDVHIQSFDAEQTQ
jgi:hypothetical protein